MCTSLIELTATIALFVCFIFMIILCIAMIVFTIDMIINTIKHFKNKNNGNT